MSAVPVQRVRKAYEQVSDQLRELISTGKLEPGERLPNEAVLAREFGVSRATVREALRLLAAHSLIRTAKGAGGGSYVTLPTVDHVSELVRSNLRLLADTRSVSLEELLEARELVEVPAARLAALRRGEEDIDRLRASIPGEPQRMGSQEQFVYNKEFHAIVVDAARNSLLTLATRPLFSVLQTHLSRSTLGKGYHRSIVQHHERITEAIAAADADGAAAEMRTHLEFLRPYYEKAWKAARA